MRHAILCLASYGRDSLKAWLMQFPTDSDICFYIHIDHTCVDDRITLSELQEINPNVMVVEHHYESRRFSFAMVDAMVWLLQTAYNGGQYDYFHFMSESCWLIKPMWMFKQRFEQANDKSFMFYQSPKNFRFYSPICRPLYKTSQWMSLHRNLVADLLSKEHLDKIELYRKLIKQRQCRIFYGAWDEVILQTIIRRDICHDNTQEIASRIINDSLRYINWFHAHGRPRILTLSDCKSPEYKYDQQAINNALIVRKIDYKNDDSIAFVHDQLNKYNVETK